MTLHSSRTGRSRWWMVLIVALVAVGTVALVSTALAPPPTAESTVEPWTPAPREDGALASSPPETPSPTSTVDPAVTEVVPPQRYLAAIDATSAWRVDVGTCPSTAVRPELTTNAGERWARSDATSSTSASGVLAARASLSGLGMVTLNSANCEAPQYTSLIDGVWQTSSNEAVEGIWFFVPGQGELVHSAGQVHSAPCVPVGIADLGALNAAVLCSQGAVVRTEDGGATWSEEVSVPGAVAITAGSDNYIVGAIDRRNCDGVELLWMGRSLSQADGAELGCFETNVEPGLVAISSSPDALWIWAGNSLGISLDGGRTW